MSAVGLLTIVGVLAYMFFRDSYSRYYLWFSFGLVGFFYMVSMKLVLIIGFERFFAIKLPLKHRLWHSNRKTLCRKICGAWSLSAIMISVAVLGDYFAQITKGPNATISQNLGYALATYMSCGALVILVIYTWTSSLVVMRAANLLSFDKKDYKPDPKIMKLARKKERATVIICGMVLVAFLTCNVPVIVGLYRGNLDRISANVSNLSAITNPLIYFFKGYIERCYGKKKIVLNSTELRGIKNKSEFLSSKPRTSDTAAETAEVDIVEKAANGDLSKSTYQELRGSWDKSRGSSLLPSKNDTLEELGYVNEVENYDFSKPTNQDLGMSKDEGEVTSSEAAKPILSLGMGILNTAAAFDVCESDGEKLEGLKDSGERSGSKDSGERSLKMSASDTAL